MSASETDVSASPQPAPPGRSRWRREALAFAELFALSGIAIAQPLLDLLSKNTGVFVAHRTTTFEALLLVVLILASVPLVLWAAEVAVGALVPSARRWAHALFAGVLVGAIALETVKKQTTLPASKLIFIAAIVGLIGAALVFLFVLVRQFLHVLAIAPLVFALIFVGASPATSVIFASSTASAASGAGITSPHRVVFIMLDEFPEESLLDGSGHVDSQLYPNFASFANGSTWYRNETTVAPFTDFAVPAILTGMYPKKPSALPTLADYPRNLFTLLGKAYSMNVHETVTRLCPSNLCKESGSSGGFGGLVSQTEQLWREYVSPKRTKFSFADDAGVGIAIPTSRQFVQSLQPSKDPRLDFVHIVFPHNPWHFLPTLQDTTSTAMKGDETLAWGDPALAAAGRQRHLLQVQAADTVLGQMIAKLKRIGEYDNSLIVVTADHGISFTAHQPTRPATQTNYPQILWPPLFIKYPGQTAPRVDDRPAQSVDILPTIAQVVGAKISYPIDGRSLLGPPRTEGARPFYQWKIPGALGLSGGPAAPGNSHLDFDGASGFKQVLAARAAPPGGDPTLRIYRGVSKYGALLDQQIAPLVHDEHGPETAALGALSNLDNVDPNAHDIPWAYREGGISHISASVSLAIGINGKVVALADTMQVAKGGSAAFFTFLLPPQLVHPGRNDLTVYIIRGTPAAPSLDPIPLVQ